MVRKIIAHDKNEVSERLKIITYRANLDWFYLEEFFKFIDEEIEHQSILLTHEEADRLGTFIEWGE